MATLSQSTPAQLVPPSHRMRTLTRVLGLGLAMLSLGFGSFWALGPDRELSFRREVPLVQAAQASRALLADPAAWPKWHYELKGLKREGTGPLRVGERLTLTIVPKGYSWRTFYLWVEVTGLTADSSISLKLLEDSAGKITRLFEDVRWTIRIDEARNLAIGELSARTRHWRSRLYGGFAPKIILNQIFYPDLFLLSGHKPQQSFSLTPEPSG